MNNEPLPGGGAACEGVVPFFGACPLRLFMGLCAVFVAWAVFFWIPPKQ